MSGKAYDDSFMDDFDLYGGGEQAEEQEPEGQRTDTPGEHVSSASPNLGADSAAHNTSYTPAPMAYNPEPLPPLDRTPLQKRRGGRMPRLMRFEVEMIRADGRSVTEAAKHYGVSMNTIRRVREIGCFAGVPYIPADEYDNRVTMVGNRGVPVQTPMSKFVHGAPTKDGRKFGRPYAKRSKPFTDAELYDIASSANVRELAEQYNVSRSTIHNIKKRMGAVLPQGMSLIDVALTDPRPSSELARQYGDYYKVTAGWIDHVRQYGEPPQPRDPSLPRGTTADGFRRGAVAPVTMEGNEGEGEGE